MNSASLPTGTSPTSQPPDPAPLLVEKLEFAHTVVVRAAGSIDVATAELWLNTLTAAMSTERSRLVIDLDDCDYIDSAGLGILVRVHRWGRRQSRTVVVATEQPAILRLLRVAGLDKVFTVQASRPALIEPTEIPRQPTPFPP